MGIRSLTLRGGPALLAIVILVIFLGLFSSYRTERIPDDITVAIATQPEMALLFIAYAEGFFERENIHIRFKRFSLGKDAIDNVLQGESDLATVFSTPFLNRVYNDHNIQALTKLHSSSENTKLVVRNDLGIDVPDDLLYKKIGYVADTNMEYFLHSYLLSVGIPETKVSMVPIDMNMAERSLLDGTVDAMTMYGFTLRRVLHEHPNTLTAFESDVYREYSLLAGKSEYIDTHKELLKRFLMALHDAQEFYENDKDRAAEVVASFLGDNTSLASVHEAFKNAEIGLGLDNVLLSSMEVENQWRVAEDIEHNKTNKSLPNVREHIHEELLGSIMPRSITIF